MTDLEITRKCAEAMGITVEIGTNGAFIPTGHFPDRWVVYDPFNNDVQAMALLKRFPIDCLNAMCREGSKDFNRTICLCVANMTTSPSSAP